MQTKSPYRYTGIFSIKMPVPHGDHEGTITSILVTKLQKTLQSSVTNFFFACAELPVDQMYIYNFESK